MKSKKAPIHAEVVKNQFPFAKLWKIANKTIPMVEMNLLGKKKLINQNVKQTNLELAKDSLKLNLIRLFSIYT